MIALVLLFELSLGLVLEYPPFSIPIKFSSINNLLLLFFVLKNVYYYFS